MMPFMAKVMISMPDDLLRSIDRLAKVEHRKRSEFFKELALRYLNFKRRSKREFADLEGAASTGLSFWDNPTDDRMWNDS